MSLQRPVDRPSTWGRALAHTVVFVVLLWMVEFVDVVLGHRLDGFGVRPRSDEGLLGVLFAPLLHAGWAHLEANTVPVLVLGFLVLVTGVRRGLAATAVIWLVGGVGVWIVAPPGEVHLGASGLIFGWLVYLMIRGFFTRRAGEIILGLTLFFLYGGLLWGVLPGQPGVSWQGHLFGAIGGAVAARLLSERDPR
ncbi:MAG TPA: rhomboid family intramembrane serine protease [Nocardioides sp.]|uniref:rhomboid family intramembrane serine protease n=1 Tax=Nocardioides sp. TaxID=35761 RepID=UPI002ED85DFA